MARWQREVAAAFRDWQDIRQRRAGARDQLRRRLPRSASSSNGRSQELDALGFRAEEWEELQAEHRRLAHAASLIEAVQSALETLSEGERSALSAVSVGESAS